VQTGENRPLEAGTRVSKRYQTNVILKDFTSSGDDIQNEIPFRKARKRRARYSKPKGGDTCRVMMCRGKIRVEDEKERKEWHQKWAINAFLEGSPRPTHACRVTSGLTYHIARGTCRLRSRAIVYRPCCRRWLVRAAGSPSTKLWDRGDAAGPSARLATACIKKGNQ